MTRKNVATHNRSSGNGFVSSVTAFTHSLHPFL